MNEGFQLIQADASKQHKIMYKEYNHIKDILIICTKF